MAARSTNTGLRRSRLRRASVITSWPTSHSTAGRAQSLRASIAAAVDSSKGGLKTRDGSARCWKRSVNPSNSPRRSSRLIIAGNTAGLRPAAPRSHAIQWCSEASRSRHRANSATAPSSSESEPPMTPAIAGAIAAACRNASVIPWPRVGSLNWPASPTSAQPGPADSRKKLSHVAGSPRHRSRAPDSAPPAEQAS